MNHRAAQAGAAITADQALDILGKVISRASFYAALRRGEVPHLRLGKRIIIPRVAFNRWLDGTAALPRPAAQLEEATR